MIATAKTSPIRTSNRRRKPRNRTVTKTVMPAWHAGYLRMLPDICRQAKIRLRHWPAEARADAVQEIVADTVVAYARLAEFGKEELAFPMPLVNYAVKKFCAGRRVGNRLNIRDVMSKYCQRRKAIAVERLDYFDDKADEWQEILVEDRHASPADVAAIRIDFREWLKTLPVRTRRIAELLATGESTSAIAQMFSITASRISQLRQELRRSWFLFVGDPDPVQIKLAPIFA